jgi:phage shock protein PspC (stress-responsive transcriptional regulator)
MCRNISAYPAVRCTEEAGHDLPELPTRATDETGSAPRAEPAGAGSGAALAIALARSRAQRRIAGVWGNAEHQGRCHVHPDRLSSRPSCRVRSGGLIAYLLAWLVMPEQISLDAVVCPSAPSSPVPPRTARLRESAVDWPNISTSTTPIRLLWVVLTVIPGALIGGVALYLVAWLIMPGAVARY